jgi:hypothetical protein
MFSAMTDAFNLFKKEVGMKWFNLNEGE